MLLLLGLGHSLCRIFRLNHRHFLLHAWPQWLSLQWMKVKFSRAVLIIFILLNFSMAGYLLQFLIYSQQQQFASPFLLLIPAAMIAVFLTVFMTHCFNQVIAPDFEPMPQTLLGRLATLQANARPASPALALVRDTQGQLHQIQVEPEYGELEQGSHVMIIRQKKNYYVVKRIAQSNQLLLRNF